MPRVNSGDNAPATACGVTTAEGLHEATVSVLQQARRQVDILSQDLEPRLYGEPAVLDALRRLAVSQRRARIRLLARDVERAVRHGHGILELARRLTTFIEIREIAVELDGSADAFLIADRREYIYRANAARPEAELERAASHTACKLAERFDGLWVHAHTNPQTRRLHL